MVNSRDIRILSIEDELRVRESIVDWLGDSGYSMLEAEDGIVGVETFKRERPDLVLLDMGLPGLNGLEVLASIHAASPDTPVIIVSAKADISDAISAFKAGAWDYITKPIVNFDILEQTIRNCLERKDLREAVRRAQERYQRLVQNLPVVIFSLTPQMRLDFINDTCEGILGYPPEEAMAEAGWIIEHTVVEDREGLEKALRRGFDGEEFLHEFRFEHRKGYLVYLRARSMPMDEERADSGPHVHGVITDVTERQFLDKVLIQREKLNTLGAISHELAHEIRNPLMALGGFARVLARKHPDMAEIEVIVSETKRIEELMNRISSYLAPVPVKSRICSVNALLTFCLDRLASSSARGNLDIVNRLASDLPAIKSDSDLLTETFYNILNHILSSVTGKGRLMLSTREIAGHVVVGFDVTAPADTDLTREQELLILPFDGEGSSVSLAVSFRNLKNLGGHLSFERKNGTVSFTVSLPKILPQGVDAAQ
ncbi:PAS domain S-box-containing protein [Desulfobaculum xiamenense]|uniref:histidine kinase n=1 Tax=Desulfobaculum xiamenense TaxID=995050 RepID=A0A846QQ83_9BACT|nr:response regulator [Desulfobaculum xiamenense]NJB69337.1 PAS domain S-box-containing protein [Desulfobaculum xiamenense]